MAFSIGGRLAYWSLCCDREAGSFDVTIPFGQPNRWWYSGDTTNASRSSPATSRCTTTTAWTAGAPTGMRAEYTASTGRRTPGYPTGEAVPPDGQRDRRRGSRGPRDGAAAACADDNCHRHAARADDHATEAAARRRDPEDDRRRAPEARAFQVEHRRRQADRKRDAAARSRWTRAASISRTRATRSTRSSRALPYLSPALQSQTRAYIRRRWRVPTGYLRLCRSPEGAARAGRRGPARYRAVFNIGKQTRSETTCRGTFRCPPSTRPGNTRRSAGGRRPALRQLETEADPSLQARRRAILLSGHRCSTPISQDIEGYLELEKLAGQPESALVRRNTTGSSRCESGPSPSMRLGSGTGMYDGYRNFILARHSSTWCPNWPGTSNGQARRGAGGRRHDQHRDAGTGSSRGTMPRTRREPISSCTTWRPSARTR